MKDFKESMTQSMSSSNIVGFDGHASDIFRRKKIHYTFLDLVLAGDYEGVRMLLQQEHIDVNYLRSRERLSANSSVHSSVLAGGTFVSASTGMTADTLSEQETALSLAIENGHSSIVELLLKNKANPDKVITKANAKYDNRAIIYAPLFLAINKNDEKIANLLLNYGANVNNMKLPSIPATDKRIGKERFADKDRKYPVYNMSLLHVVIEKNISGFLTQSLIEKGASVNAVAYYVMPDSRRRNKFIAKMLIWLPVAALIAYFITDNVNKTCRCNSYDCSSWYCYTERDTHGVSRAIVTTISFGLFIGMISFIKMINSSNKNEFGDFDSISDDKTITPLDLAKSLNRKDHVVLLESLKGASSPVESSVLKSGFDVLFRF